MFSQNDGLYNMPVQGNQNMNYPMQNNNMGYQQQYPSPIMQSNPYSQQLPDTLRNAFYPSYKKGGRVDMHEMAGRVQDEGREGDTVLAHINPMEQEILKQYGGSGSTNPATGLPEYKFNLRKLFKILGAIAAPIAGAYFGGPLGAILGGATHGALSHSSKNRMKGALGGGLGGLGYAALAPMLGNALGVEGGGMMGKALGMQNAPLMTQLGMGGQNAATMGGGLGLQSLLQWGGAGNRPPVSGGGGNMGGGMMGLSPLQLALGATAIGGGLAGRARAPKEESIQEYMQRNAVNRGSESKGKKYKYNREYAEMPEDYIGMEQGERPYFKNADFEEIPNYAFGGAIPGSGSGQSDKIDVKSSPGEYWLRADVVSRLGDGNTNAGFKILDKFQDDALKTNSKSSKKLPPQGIAAHKLMKLLGV